MTDGWLTSVYPIQHTPIWIVTDRKDTITDYYRHVLSKSSIRYVHPSARLGKRQMGGDVVKL